LKGLKGAEIAALRKAGENVSQVVDKRLFLFLGDTTASVFTTTPELLLFPVIICECTFIDQADIEQAAKTK
jgi:ribonuclease Z